MPNKKKYRFKTETIEEKEIWLEMMFKICLKNSLSPKTLMADVPKSLYSNFTFLYKIYKAKTIYNLSEINENEKLPKKEQCYIKKYSTILLSTVDHYKKENFTINLNSMQNLNHIKSYPMLNSVSSFESMDSLSSKNFTTISNDFVFYRDTNYFIRNIEIINELANDITNIFNESYLNVSNNSVISKCSNKNLINNNNELNTNIWITSVN